MWQSLAPGLPGTDGLTIRDEVDLSNTDVTGALRVNSVLKKLEILKLTGTRTKIDFMGRRIEVLRAHSLKWPPWRSVGWPWTPRCPNSWLRCSDCFHLNSIGAAGCGLTGKVPKTALFYGKERSLRLDSFGPKFGVLGFGLQPHRQSGFDPEKVELLGACRQ